MWGYEAHGKSLHLLLNFVVNSKFSSSVKKKKKKAADRVSHSIYTSLKETMAFPFPYIC